MTDDGFDPRRKAILQAAWQAFATYGFRKTSMDDIARNAGMSRPALYLHFRSKEDIFRTLVQAHYDEAAAAVAAALAGPGPVAEQLSRAFAGQGGATTEAILTSPHGREVLDLGLTTAADVKQAGEARLTGLYADWLAAQATAGRVRLTGPATDVARTMTASLKGIKMTADSFDAYTTQVAQLAAVMGAGLTA